MRGGDDRVPGPVVASGGGNRYFAFVLYPDSAREKPNVVSERPDPASIPATITAGKPYALVVLLQLHWFIRLRWVFAAAALSLLGVERFIIPESQRPWQLLAAVLSVGVVNLVWTLVSRIFHAQADDPGRDLERVIKGGQVFAGGQIAIDLFLLTWILTLSGGIENPMALFYLFHIAITGLLLRTWQAFMQSCWAFLLYVLMCVGHMQGWLPHYPFLPQLDRIGLYEDPRYVSIVIGVMGLAVFGTLYFTDRIGKVMDRREAILIRTNAALQRSQRVIQDLQRRRSRFMQTAAHQLKSPLAMVQTLANLIRDRIVTDPKDIQSTCDKIARRAHDGIAQVTELLALARVQEADPRRHRESKADIGQVVSDLCHRHSPIAKEKRIQMTWDIPVASLVAHVDRVDLTDCVGNLIDNAIKYTPGGGEVNVAVVCGPDAPDPAALPAPPVTLGESRGVEDYVFVIVRDTGMGLDEVAGNAEEEAVPGSVLFDAFRRGSRALAAGIPGTGLGLSIVREVVEQAGGYIHVYSQPGRGSTFTVAFPAECAPLTEPVRETRASKVVVEPSTGFPGREES